MNALALLTTFLPAILQAGGIAQQTFPAIAQIIQAIQGGVSPPAQQTNIISLIQEALNALQQAGEVSFGAPLKVDGVFGSATFGAIKALQTKLGVSVQEPLASIEMRVLATLLAKV